MNQVVELSAQVIVAGVQFASSSVLKSTKIVGNGMVVAVLSIVYT